MPQGIVTGIVATSALHVGSRGKRQVYQLGAFKDMVGWLEAGCLIAVRVDHDKNRVVGKVLKLKALKEYSRRLPPDLRDGTVALWAGMQLDLEVEEAREIWRDIGSWQFSLGGNWSFGRDRYKHGDYTHLRGVGPLLEISITKKPANTQTRVLTFR